MKTTLNEIVLHLKNAGIENPRRDALLLASAFEGVSDASLLCDPDGPLTSEKLIDAVERRANREPLQYILGEWEFMSLPFLVSPSCLIPRPDTEILVEYAIKHLPKNGTLLDLCTGSGCIAVAAAYYRPDVSVTAVEKYPEALAAARKNADLNGVSERIEFILGDVTDPAFPRFFEENKFDAIVSNPPYVSAEEMKFLEPELACEPRHALTDEGDGLSIIEAIVDIYPSYLSPGGLLIVEHGFRQGEAARRLMSRFGECFTLTDLGGRERATALRTRK